MVWDFTVIGANIVWQTLHHHLQTRDILSPTLENNVIWEKKCGRYSSFTFYAVFTLTYLPSNKNDKLQQQISKTWTKQARQSQLKEEAVELELDTHIKLLTILEATLSSCLVEIYLTPFPFHFFNSHNYVASRLR